MRQRTISRTLLASLAAGAAFAGTDVSAQAATTPGAVTFPHPTLEHLSIDWAVTGDDDADATVAVRFRVAGTSTWRDAMQLLRVPAGSNEGFSWTNRHSGSLFGLAPGTTYEVELVLADPDGGGTTRVESATTRRVPSYDEDAAGTRVDPSTIDAALDGAEPGDVFVLAPGTYGDLVVTVDGTEEEPIVLRSEDASATIVDGEIRLDGRSHVFVVDLTVRGRIKLNDSRGIVITGCAIEATTTSGDGIVAYGEGSIDGYFADNLVVGRTVWAESSFGVSGDNVGEGIVLTGPGNVIAHNRVVGFRDCISLMEDDEAVDQVSIDILDNDLEVCADDGIEADFAMGNVRVLRNRIGSSFIALSSQPSLGGPTWFVRNVAYANVFQAFKPNRGSVGDQFLHNTIVKSGDAMGVYAGTPWSRATFRNNLMIGGPGGSYNGFANGTGRVLEVPDLVAVSSSLDYDGLGSVGTGTFSGHVGAVSFGSLDALRSTTTEVHATEVSLAVFATPPLFPADPLVRRAVPDLRLASGSAAIDRGLAMPNLDDGYAGTAPDLGAYELGSAPPSYGPRDGVAPVCGNGTVDLGETCDDSNTADGDGCSSTCGSEEVTPPRRGSEGGCGCGVGGGAPAGDAFLVSVVLASIAASRFRRARTRDVVGSRP